MANRTEQDNDISLYTLAELRVMLAILKNKNSTSFVPFTEGEILAEIINRTCY